MTIATPLSLRWERAQQIDRSAIEPLSPATQSEEKKYSPNISAGEHLGPAFWVTPSIGIHSRRASPKAGVTLASGTGSGHLTREGYHSSGR
jgi:hypothetical protein